MTIAIIIIAVAVAAVVVWLLMRRHRRRQEIFIKFRTMSGSMLVYTIRNEEDLYVRVMDVDGAYESATYLDDDLVYELVFDYHRAYNHVFDSGTSPQKMLMVGGGGYAYPKYIVSHYPQIHMDVVEIDPMVTSIAERYFFLDRLIAEFDTESTGQLGLFNEDGRKYLDDMAARIAAGSDEGYDAIFNDCFLGRNPAMQLATLEADSAVHACLNPGGMYLSNVISALDGEESTFLHSIVATLQQIFAHVYVIPGKPDEPQVRDNNVVVATDADYSFEGAIELEVHEGVEVFRDVSNKMYEELFRAEDVKG